MSPSSRRRRRKPSLYALLTKRQNHPSAPRRSTKSLNAGGKKLNGDDGTRARTMTGRPRDSGASRSARSPRSSQAGEPELAAAVACLVPQGSSHVAIRAPQESIDRADGQAGEPELARQRSLALFHQAAAAFTMRALDISQTRRVAVEARRQDRGGGWRGRAIERTGARARRHAENTTATGVTAEAAPTKRHQGWRAMNAAQWVRVASTFSAPS